MRLLILGGTVFLGREIAEQAVAAGCEVTCAARGVSGTAPVGATFVRVDREQGLDPLDGLTFDAVVDTAREPAWVRAAARAFAGRVGHWTFVSTGNVYTDEQTPGQRADTAPLRSPDGDDYGNLKVACEQEVRTAGPALIARAGLIVGPNEVAPRFPYWPIRLARGGAVLAPGDPDRLVQYIDVADLAAWLLDAARRGLTGDFDAAGPPRPFGKLLLEMAPDAELTWVDQEFLLAHGVSQWSGERSLPLWLRLPEYGGFLTRDTSPAAAAGLKQRPVAQTAARILEWWDSQELAAGLTATQEAELLAAWHAR